MITMPMSAPRVPAMAVAAGWGGRMQWTVISEIANGRPTATRERPAALATTNTSGTSSTKPTSTKTGMPAIRPRNDIATGARLAPKTSSIEVARRSAPPETSSILPSTAPKPMTRTRKPSVPPTSPSMTATTSPRGTWVTRATARAAMVRAMEPWNLSLTMRKTMRRMASNRTATSPAVDVMMPPLPTLVDDEMTKKTISSPN